MRGKSVSAQPAIQRRSSVDLLKAKPAPEIAVDSTQPWRSNVTSPVRVHFEPTTVAATAASAAVASISSTATLPPVSNLRPKKPAKITWAPSSAAPMEVTPFGRQPISMRILPEPQRSVDLSSPHPDLNLVALTQTSDAVVARLNPTTRDSIQFAYALDDAKRAAHEAWETMAWENKEVRASTAETAQLAALSPLLRMQARINELEAELAASRAAGELARIGSETLLASLHTHVAETKRLTILVEHAGRQEADARTEIQRMKAEAEGRERALLKQVEEATRTYRAEYEEVRSEHAEMGALLGRLGRIALAQASTEEGEDAVKREGETGEDESDTTFDRQAEAEAEGGGIGAQGTETELELEFEFGSISKTLLKRGKSILTLSRSKSKKRNPLPLPIITPPNPAITVLETLASAGTLPAALALEILGHEKRSLATQVERLKAENEALKCRLEARNTVAAVAGLNAVGDVCTRLYRRLEAWEAAERSKGGGACAPYPEVMREVVGEVEDEVRMKFER